MLTCPIPGVPSGAPASCLAGTQGDILTHHRGTSGAYSEKQNTWVKRLLRILQALLTRCPTPGPPAPGALPRPLPRSLPPAPARPPGTGLPRTTVTHGQVGLTRVQTAQGFNMALKYWSVLALTNHGEPSE